MFVLMYLTSALWTQEAGACHPCGAGYTEYYEWVCDRTHAEWVLEIVGLGVYAGTCGNDFDMIWGEDSDCWITVRDGSGCDQVECPPPPDEICSTSRIPPR